ncbi:MAG: hypothetical protein FWG83_04125 [Oscillospiraceae bacterium]|nr:hypothetical protein [Oscillospiraceae bacterium]
MKIDNASWHFGGDYPNDLPDKNAYTHIGFFLKWCLLNDFASEELKEISGDDIEKVLQGTMSGADFLEINCDGKFCDDDLTEKGNEFAEDYYSTDDGDFVKKFKSYYEDLAEVFSEPETIYHVENTEENYALIARRINERYNQWLDFANQL